MATAKKTAPPAAPSRPATAAQHYKPIKHKGFSFDVREEQWTAQEIARITVYARRLGRGNAAISMDMLDILLTGESVAELEQAILSGKLDLGDAVKITTAAVETRSGRPTRSQRRS